MKSKLYNWSRYIAIGTLVYLYFYEWHPLLPFTMLLVVVVTIILFVIKRYVR